MAWPRGAPFRFNDFWIFSDAPAEILLRTAGSVNPRRKPARGGSIAPCRNLARHDTCRDAAIQTLLGGKRTRTGHRKSGAPDPKRTCPDCVAGLPVASQTGKSPLTLRHPGLAHAFQDTPAVGADRRIVGARSTPEAADGEGRIERQSGLNRGPCLVQPAELRQGGSKMEMRERMIAVGLDRVSS